MESLDSYFRTFFLYSLRTASSNAPEANPGQAGVRPEYCDLRRSRGERRLKARTSTLSTCSDSLRATPYEPEDAANQLESCTATQWAWILTEPSVDRAGQRGREGYR
jgi:hypothetical protein